MPKVTATNRDRTTTNPEMMAIAFDVSNEIALFVYTDNVEKVSMSLKSGIARPQINNEIDMTIKETRTIVVRWSFDAWRFFICREMIARQIQLTISAHGPSSASTQPPTPVMNPRASENQIALAHNAITIHVSIVCCFCSFCCHVNKYNVDDRCVQVLIAPRRSSWCASAGRAVPWHHRSRGCRF